MFNEISVLKDNCSHSYSIMTAMKISDYLSLVNNCQQLNAQRDVLRTRAATTIRKRLIEDITKGAIIPPLVLGIIVPENVHIDIDNFEESFNNAKESIVVIDGIQRTESLRKAVQVAPGIEDYNIRVEIWASYRVSSLIYRMLVLNTGQVPWNTRRQIEVIYEPLKIETESRVDGLRLIPIGDNERRSTAGEFPADKIADLFISFTSRKVTFDNKESLADDFTRLDIIDMTSRIEVSDFFFETVEMIVKLDQQFFRYSPRENNRREKMRIGRDLFTSNPSRVAFAAAISTYILGRPGSKGRSSEEQNDKMRSLKQNFNELIQRLEGVDDEGIGAYLSFEVLNEILTSLPSKRIGDEERKFFFDAYSLLIKEEFKLDSLEEAWRV